MPSIWIQALKRYNEGGMWCVPKKGTPQHDTVKAIMDRIKRGEPEPSKTDAADKKLSNTNTMEANTSAAAPRRRKRAVGTKQKYALYENISPTTGNINYYIREGDRRVVFYIGSHNPETNGNVFRNIALTVGFDRFKTSTDSVIYLAAGSIQGAEPRFDKNSIGHRADLVKYLAEDDPNPFFKHAIENRMLGENDSYYGETKPEKSNDEAVTKEEDTGLTTCPICKKKFKGAGYERHERMHIEKGDTSGVKSKTVSNYTKLKSLPSNAPALYSFKVDDYTTDYYVRPAGTNDILHLETDTYVPGKGYTTKYTKEKNFLHLDDFTYSNPRAYDVRLNGKRIKWEKFLSTMAPFDMQTEKAHELLNL